MTSSAVFFGMLTAFKNIISVAAELSRRLTVAVISLAPLLVNVSPIRIEVVAPGAVYTLSAAAWFTSLFQAFLNVFAIFYPSASAITVAWPISAKQSFISFALISVPIPLYVIVGEAL